MILSVYVFHSFSGNGSISGLSHNHAHGSRALPDFLERPGLYHEKCYLTQVAEAVIKEAELQQMCVEDMDPNWWWHVSVMSQYIRLLP